MAQDTHSVYPQATPDGEPIPFEIIRPYGAIKQAFTGTAVSNIAIPAAADFLVLRTDQPCWIQLTVDVAAAIPADGTHVAGLVYVGTDEVFVVDHNGAAEFSVIRATAENGTLIVQTVSKYADIRKRAQLERA